MFVVSVVRVILTAC